MSTPNLLIGQDEFSTDDFYMESPAQNSIRKFDTHKLDSFRNHPDFVYDDSWAPPDPTWLERAFINIFRFLSKDRGGGFTVGKLFIYGLAIIAIIAIFFGLYKMGIQQIFSRKSTDLGSDFGYVEGNIEEIDFEKLIKDARDKKAYKLGVRLLYLETLKVLTQNHYINWAPYKVNQEYLFELKGRKFFNEFEDLTQNYEYVCYGDFSIDLEGFDHVEEVFRTFQQKIGKVA